MKEMAFVVRDRKTDRERHHGGWKEWVLLGK